MTRPWIGADRRLRKTALQSQSAIRLRTLRPKFVANSARYDAAITLLSGCFAEEPRRIDLSADQRFAVAWRDEIISRSVSLRCTRSSCSMIAWRNDASSKRRCTRVAKTRDPRARRRSPLGSPSGLASCDTPSGEPLPDEPVACESRVSLNFRVSARVGSHLPGTSSQWLRRYRDGRFQPYTNRHSDLQRQPQTFA
jgi:hypothetical protein